MHSTAYTELQVNYLDEVKKLLLKDDYRIGYHINPPSDFLIRAAYTLVGLQERVMSIVCIYGDPLNYGNWDHLNELAETTMGVGAHGTNSLTNLECAKALSNLGQFRSLSLPKFDSLTPTEASAALTMAKSVLFFEGLKIHEPDSTSSERSLTFNAIIGTLELLPLKVTIKDLISAVKQFADERIEITPDRNTGSVTLKAANPDDSNGPANKNDPIIESALKLRDIGIPFSVDTNRLLDEFELGLEAA